MNKKFKKLISIVLAASFTLPTAITAMAQAYASDEIKTVAVPGGKEIVIEIGYDFDDDIKTVKKSDVTVSNKSVVKPVGVLNSAIETNGFNENKQDYYSDEFKSEIYLKTVKSGNATVKFKVGSQTLKTKIKLLKYVNPLKTLTVTGVNNGKSVHGKFNKAVNVSGAIKKNVSNATVTVAPKSGWLLTNLRVYDYASKKTSTVFALRAPAAINNVKLKKGSRVIIEMEFYHLKNNADVKLSYTLR